MRDMYRKLPPMGGQPREISEVVNNLVEGKSNNTGEFTLATGGATTTTIYNERIGFESVILLEPVTMVAATDYYPYLAVQDGTDQTAGSTTTAYAVTFNTTDYALGASLSNSSRLNVSYSGLYNLQFSIQFANDDSQIQDVDIWFRKNGTDIANSNSKFSVDSKHGSVRGHLIAALNFYVELAKNDYIEIMWATSSTLVTIEQLPAQTSPTRPATPSVIATLQYLSSNSYTTNLFTTTYVSAQTKGSATITHPANTVSDRTYRYIVVG
jgi:hypothetical protein